MRKSVNLIKPILSFFTTTFSQKVMIFYTPRQNPQKPYKYDVSGRFVFYKVANSENNLFALKSFS